MPENTPIDPDIDVGVSRQRRELRDSPWLVLGAISLGGALGALARYGVGVLLPHTPGAFPWATFAVNLSGCFLIGVLMILVTDVWPHRRLLRPFLGVGVLGGYTTFCTAIVEARDTVEVGAAGTGLAYLVGTLAGALVAVWVGSALMGALPRVRRARGRPGAAPRTPLGEGESR